MFPAPRYKELSVRWLWESVKEVQELYSYFPDYHEQDVPERDYLWTVISSVMPQETKALIQEARAARGVNKREENELVRITPQLKDEIFNVVTQKSKSGLNSQPIATKGNATYLLKQSAVLKKKRKHGKTYQACYDSFKNHTKQEEEAAYDTADVRRAMKAQTFQPMEEDKYNLADF